MSEFTTEDRLRDRTAMAVVAARCESAGHWTTLWFVRDEVDLKVYRQRVGVEPDELFWQLRGPVSLVLVAAEAAWPHGYRE